MSTNDDIFEEFKARLADKYTASELVEILRLDVWDVIEAFNDRILDWKFDE